LRRHQLEVSSGAALLEQLQPQPGGRGVDEQMQLIEQTCIEELRPPFEDAL
jgi:hypothetical protein